MSGMEKRLDRTTGCAGKGPRAGMRRVSKLTKSKLKIFYLRFLRCPANDGLTASDVRDIESKSYDSAGSLFELL
jgi:hypothetical protein